MCMKKNSFKGKAVVTFLVGCMLMLPAAPMFAKPGVWDAIKKLLGDDSIPCWSQADCPGGCTHYFTRCAGCTWTNGVPDGSQSSC